MMKVNKIYLGNNLEVLPTLPDNSVDSIITDPPYELGFMGKKWDSSGIAYSVDLWMDCLRVLKPGGHLLAFGGTRTYHRMACAIEDAGFEIRDMIEWVYGSGFPKSLNIGKAIQSLEGVDMEDTGVIHPVSRPNISEDLYKSGKVGKNFTIKKCTTVSAKKNEGFGTAIKPAHEPICVARKPLSESTVAKNVLKYGTGGINIEDCRVEWDQKGLWNDTKRRQSPRTDITGSEFHASCGGDNAGKFIGDINSPSGRFPANLIHDGSEEVRAMFPDTKSGKAELGTGTIERQHNGIYGSGKGGVITTCYADSGSASSFFKACEFTDDDLPAFIYCAKASVSEREAGCESLPGKKQDESRKDGNPGGDNPRNRGVHIRGNHHATVKPLTLMRYLCRLVTPPGGTVLDPFAGSGTTLVAAKVEGFNYIGIEMEADYVKIAEARILAWKPESIETSEQLKLF